MTRQRLLKALERLNVWKRGRRPRARTSRCSSSGRSGRIRRGGDRLASYERDAEEPLKRLLRDFGPRRKVLHPENPFWHLQTDDLWEVDAALSFAPGRGPTRSDLVRNDVSGGLPEPLYKLLRLDSELLRAAADLLLFGHFPESMHDAIREQVGLPRDTVGAVRRGGAVAPPPPAAGPGLPRSRAAGLRAPVRRLRLRPAHRRRVVRPRGRPHHVALARRPGRGPERSRPLHLPPQGVRPGRHRPWNRSPASTGCWCPNELSGQSPAFREVLDLRHRSLRPPQEEEFQPEGEYVDWHRRQVFRGAPRSRPEP